MKKRKKLFISIIAVLVLLSGLEIFFRIRYETTYNNSCIYQYDEQLMFKMAANGIYKTKNGVVHFNKYGYIGPQWDIEKDTNTYRVAVVGTCAVSGVFHIEDTVSYNFPSLAQIRLNKLGYNVEIMNFGIPGEQRTFYNFQTIREDVMKFRPDLIMLEFSLPFSASNYTRDCYRGYRIDYVANLPESRNKAEKWVNKLIDRKFLRILYDNCYIFKAIGRNYSYRSDDSLATFFEFIDKRYVIVDQDKSSSYYSLNKSIEMVNELIEELNEKNMKLYLYNYKYNTRSDSICLKNNLPLVSLDCEFEKNMFYKNDSHINCLGQIEICNKFCTFLIKEMIPQKYKQEKPIANR